MLLQLRLQRSPSFISCPVFTLRPFASQCFSSLSLFAFSAPYFSTLFSLPPFFPPLPLPLQLPSLTSPSPPHPPPPPPRPQARHSRVRSVGESLKDGDSRHALGAKQFLISSRDGPYHYLLSSGHGGRGSVAVWVFCVAPYLKFDFAFFICCCYYFFIINFIINNSCGCSNNISIITLICVFFRFYIVLLLLLLFLLFSFLCSSCLFC